MPKSQACAFLVLVSLLHPCSPAGAQRRGGGLRHVIDSASILREGDRAAIESILDELRRKSNTHVLVVTVEPLSEERFLTAVEDLFEAWAPEARDRLLLAVGRDGRFTIRLSGRPAELFSGSRLSERLNRSLAFGDRAAHLSDWALSSAVDIAVTVARDSNVALEGLGMQRPALEVEPHDPPLQSLLDSIPPIWLFGGLALVVLALALGIQRRWIHPESWWDGVNRAGEAVLGNREYGSYLRSTESGKMVFTERWFGTLLRRVFGVLLIGFSALVIAPVALFASLTFMDRLIWVVVLLSLVLGGVRLLRTRKTVVTLDRGGDRVESNGELRCYLSRIEFVTITETQTRREGIQHHVKVQLDSGDSIEVFEGQANYDAALALARVVKEVAGVPFRADPERTDDSGITRLNLSG